MHPQLQLLVALQDMTEMTRALLMMSRERLPGADGAGFAGLQVARLLRNMVVMLLPAIPVALFQPGLQ